MNIWGINVRTERRAARREGGRGAGRHGQRRGELGWRRKRKGGAAGGGDVVGEGGSAHARCERCRWLLAAY